MIADSKGRSQASRRRWRGFGFVALPLVSGLVAGCLSAAPRMQPEAPVDTRSGYVYGRFTIGASVDDPAPRAALVLVEVASGKRFNLEFTDNRAPSAVAVPPGRYAIRGLDVAVPIAAKGHTDLSRSLLAVPFTVETGRAYYLGDYRLMTRFDVAPDLFVTSYTTSWRLAALNDEYEITTEDIRRIVPGLARAETARAIDGLPEAESWWDDPLPNPQQP